jgi:hypothetical protein
MGEPFLHESTSITMQSQTSTSSTDVWEPPGRCVLVRQATRVVLRAETVVSIDQDVTARAERVVRPGPSGDDE